MINLNYACCDNGTIFVSDEKIESRYYTLTFDNNTNIVSLYDKENDREVVGDNGVYKKMTIQANMDCHFWLTEILIKISPYNKLCKNIEFNFDKIFYIPKE